MRILTVDAALGDAPLIADALDRAGLDAELAVAVAAPFDVTTDAPIRLALWNLGPDDHVLALVAHHIAADGWSHGPLVADLSVAYTARAAGRPPQWEPLPLQYADYTLWQHRRLGDRHDPRPTAARQLAHWAQALDGAPDRLPLPTDRVRVPGSGRPGGTGAVIDFEIGADIGAALTELAHRHNATPFMAGYAAFAVLLGDLAGIADVTVGTPVAGRGHPALDRLVGMFVNTLPLRLALDPREHFTMLLARQRGRARRARQRRRSLRSHRRSGESAARQHQTPAVRGRVLLREPAPFAHARSRRADRERPRYPLGNNAFRPDLDAA